MNKIAFNSPGSAGYKEQKTINRSELPSQPMLSRIKKRILQSLACFMPGCRTVRVRLHRWRGVNIGTGVQIGRGVLIETEFPEWVSIGNGVQIGIRTIIIPYMHGLPPSTDNHGEEKYVSVRIEDDVNIGPSVIVLPNVTIGQGAVVTAGSVVTCCVPPLTMVQGNPARPIAQCGIPLTWETPLKEFFRKLRPIPRK